MARVAGIDIPKQKRVDIALRYIYGIGPHMAGVICEATNVNPSTRVKDLTDAEIGRINAEISKSHRVEGDLRRDVQGHIKRLMEIGCYRGLRHRRSLPVRGQRTKSNGRTRRGRRRTVGAAKPGIVAAPATAAK